MKVNRMTRVNELLKREIASALFRIANQAGFDLSAITVTHVITTSDLFHSRVLISIRDHEQERERMLRYIRSCGHELRETIRRNIVLRHIPELSFELDHSIEEGDRVLQIISQLETQAEAPPTPAPPAEETP